MASSMGPGIAIAEDPPPFDETRWGQRSRFAAPPSAFFEIAVVAVGERAQCVARHLQEHPCCRPDYDAGFAGARVVTALATHPPMARPQDTLALRDWLAEGLRRAHWVLVIRSDNDLWNALGAGDAHEAYQLFGGCPHIVDLLAPTDTAFSPYGEWARWHDGLVMGPSGRPGAFTGNAHLTGVPEALVHALFGPLWIGIEAEHIHNTLYSGFGMGIAGYGRGKRGASPETALQQALAHWRSTRNAVDAAADAVMVALLSSGDDPTSVTALEVMAEHALAEAAEADNAQCILATPAVRDGPPEALVLSKHPLEPGRGRRS